MTGRTLRCSAWRTMHSSSVNFSTTGMTFLPTLRANIAIWMNSSSLKPLQMIGVASLLVLGVALRQGEDGHQLGLAAGLEAEVERLAEVEDLLDDLALLVHLDRVDAAVAVLVLGLLDGVLERLVQLADAVPEDVGEAEEDRQLDAARLELVDQLLEIDVALAPLGRMDLEVAGLVDREVALAPVADAVGLDGVLNLPLLHQHRLGGLRHRRRLLHEKHARPFSGLSRGEPG